MSAPLSLHHRVHRHLHRNIGHTIHALIHHIETMEFTLLGIAFAIGFSTISSFAGTTTQISETKELIYPLKQVTTLPCRTQMKLWSDLDASCKITLPTILKANYVAFSGAKVDKDTSYMSIYTTLWGASYKGQRDMDKGDHAGVDIATAKGTPLYAIAHGLVTFAGEQMGYGNVVKIMFRYQGSTYHVVTAHMDTITVKKGDIVEQGTLIGTVGNSGSTFGALGGNHVHWEINHDQNGSSMFYYANCPALVTDKKTFTEITNGGLCRSYREKAQVDPIAMVESSKSRQVASLTTTTTVAGESYHAVALKPEFLELKKINPTKLTKDAILFVRDRDIQVVLTHDKTMKLKSEGTVQVYVTKKGIASLYDGSLPTSFALVSPTGGLKPSQSTIQYLNKGTQKVTFTASKIGIQKLAISLGGQTIGVIQVKVVK